MKATSRFAWIMLLAGTALPVFAQTAGQNVYVRSNMGTPWGQSTNEDAMNLVFGSDNWTTMYYETLDPIALLSSSTSFIFLEGGDSSFTGFQSFMIAHGDTRFNHDGTSIGDGLISTWVGNGGRLLIMSAPNDPLLYQTVQLPDGIVLHADAFYQSAATSAYAVDASPSNAIFNSPNQTGYNFTGDFFAHGYFSGDNLGSLMQSNLNEVILGEDIIGSGLMIVGGLTTDNFQLPQPKAHQLLQNILTYTLNASVSY